ncbi:MAG TPA: hypothetical protein VGQ62_11780 [Chloroflexota bacterium]|jgi:hypothetical protein|nr:hypothetical protein [Chloroflexota bacterium]
MLGLAVFIAGAWRAPQALAIFGTWSVAVVTLGAVVSLAWALTHRPTMLHAAQQADRQRGLRNRLATSVELLEDRITAGLKTLQLAETTRLAVTVPPASAFPRTGRSARNAAFIGAAALVALVATAAFIASRSVAVEPEPLAGSEPLPASETQPTDAAAPVPVPIVEASTPQQLQQLRARSATEQAALALLSDQLKKTAAARDVGQALQRGDVNTASALLNQLAQDSDQLSQTAKQELASAMLNASKGTASLDKDLAAAEVAVTQAMTRSDYQSARKALQTLAAAVVTSQAGTLTQQQLVQQIQQLERQAATQGNGADCGVLTDDGEYFQDCSAVGQAMSSGTTGVQSRGVGQSPTAGVGEVAGGHGFATSGVDLDPLGQNPTHLNLPTADVPVDVPLSSAQGNGVPSEQQAPTLAISQTSQQGVTQAGGTLSSEAGNQPLERTVVRPAERTLVRNFFQATDGGTGTP